MTKRNMRSFFPEPFLPLPLSSRRHNTKWKVYNATPFLPATATDPRCNKRRHSFSAVPSFLACSISLPPSLPLFAHNNEGRQTLFAPRSSFLYPRVADAWWASLSPPLANYVTPPERRLLPAVASFPKLLPLSIMHSICHSSLAGRPAYYCVAGRHISRHLPHPPLSDPPSLLFAMFGLGLLWWFTTTWVSE